MIVVRVVVGFPDFECAVCREDVTKIGPVRTVENVLVGYFAKYKDSVFAGFDLVNANLIRCFARSVYGVFSVWRQETYAASCLTTSGTGLLVKIRRLLLWKRADVPVNFDVFGKGFAAVLELDWSMKFLVCLWKISANSEG